LVVLNLCAFHADGHRKSAFWSRVIEEMREAEKVGNFALVDELDREQMAIMADTNGKDDFPEFID
jgi:hypothetical protein